MLQPHEKVFRGWHSVDGRQLMCLVYREACFCPQSLRVHLSIHLSVRLSVTRFLNEPIMGEKDGKWLEKQSKCSKSSESHPNGPRLFKMSQNFLKCPIQMPDLFIAGHDYDMWNINIIICLSNNWSVVVTVGSWYCVCMFVCKCLRVRAHVHVSACLIVNAWESLLCNHVMFWVSVQKQPFLGEMGSFSPSRTLMVCWHDSIGPKILPLPRNWQKIWPLYWVLSQ